MVLQHYPTAPGPERQQWDQLLLASSDGGDCWRMGAAAYSFGDVC